MKFIGSDKTAIVVEVKVVTLIILAMAFYIDTSIAFTTLAQQPQIHLGTTTSLSSSSSSSDISNLNLTPQLEKMTKAFSSTPDEKTKHKQLLYMANQLSPMNPSLMIPENKVPGCLSTVYVDCTTSTNENNELVLDYVGTSDGLLTKGLVALLIRGLSGCTPDQIQKVNPEFISAAGITQSLTPGRNNGFLNMLAVMKNKAAQAAGSESDEVNGVKSSDSVDDNDDEGETTNGIITSFEPIEGKPMYNAMMESLLKLKPTHLSLIDNSDQHEGHAGSKGYNGESHFSLEIVSDVFDGMALVKRHQLIYLVLGEVMEKIHALQISAKSPDEVH